eukprot:COSAG01_NODE_17053_length_1182_cov_1.485688_2_plen_152_part_00
MARVLERGTCYGCHLPAMTPLPPTATTTTTTTRRGERGAAAVSRCFLAWIGSPCLRPCVHGASTGGGGGGGGAVGRALYITELAGAHVGYRVWDCGLVVLRHLWELERATPHWARGLRVLELGSGTGLVGLGLWMLGVSERGASIPRPRLL